MLNVVGDTVDCTDIAQISFSLSSTTELCFEVMFFVCFPRCVFITMTIMLSSDETRMTSH